MQVISPSPHFPLLLSSFSLVCLLELTKHKFLPVCVVGPFAICRRCTKTWIHSPAFQTTGDSLAIAKKEQLTKIKRFLTILVRITRLMEGSSPFVSRPRLNQGGFVNQTGCSEDTLIKDFQNTI